ncbi:HHIP-like protein 1 [Fibrella aestuarina BUZ 2]|uniref:HHIP-like protein 1 n=1 Tax=Fibrella aestuarina BUZ 2 TaxID=1166018 RepID=I0KE33_9BACT|nr:PQQ-dependent sugar dehydrogenase [Fibrella aestuarina]CCH02386.1 HHIP-like protein 1 [Fibrella aestuarina BUZ 2]
MSSRLISPAAFRLLLTWLLSQAIPASAQQGPPGFSITQVSARIPGRSVDMDFDPQNRMYTCEKNGRVWVSMNGAVATNPLIDIREEVATESDLGLLCLTLDPNFSQNGHLYLGYVVDRYHLLYAGTPGYDPNQSASGATIVRITRYTVTPASLTATNANNVVVQANSRRVLVGESAQTGIPVLDGSHSGVALVFGADGTLLVTTGDGAGLSGADKGGAGNPGYGSAYWQQGLQSGIITFKENIGSYRSQYLDSHNGKVLRIDPATGDGVPSNPYYEVAHPRSARSRVFARGLRNPFRASLRPNTGSTNPADANPGSLYIADVGWSRFEELHILKHGGQNFGWPYFEGLSFTDGRSEFYTIPPNQIVNPNDSTQNIYYNWLPDPADSLGNFSKADLMYGRTGGETFFLEHGHAEAVPDLHLPYQNVTSGGRCIIGGGWTRTGGTLPEAYQNKYFFGDYNRNWIAYAEFDTDDHPMAVEPFGYGFDGLVSLMVNPNDNNLYSFFLFLLDPFKIEFTGNQTPKAVIAATPTYGSSPLSVTFSATESSDLESTALTYAWNFGDGSSVVTQAQPVHVYTATGSRSYTATLTVTDGGGATGQATQLISVNNTPPAVVSTSLDGLSVVSATSPTLVALSAVVTDAESATTDLTYQWKLLSMHNDHAHEGGTFTTASPTVTLTPLGNCSSLETYWYRVVLTVTDPSGLAVTVNKDIYPDCAGSQQTIEFPAPRKRAKTSAPFRPLVWSTSGLPVSLYVLSGPAFMEGSAIRLMGTAGRVRLRVAQHGSDLYRPAFTVEREFDVVGSLAPSADLSLQLVFDQRAIKANEPVPAQLTIANDGPDDATNVTISSWLPAGLAFVSSPSLTPQASGVLSGTVAAVLAGTSETLPLTVLPTAPGTYRLAAQVSSSDAFDEDSQPGSGTGDGEDDMTIAELRTTDAGGSVSESPNPNQTLLPPVFPNQPRPVANRVDLSLKLALSTRAVAVGQPVELSVVVTNAGSLSAAQVVVRDTLWGASLAASSVFTAIASTAQYTVIQATIGSLAIDGSAVLTATITPNAAGWFRNAVQVWSVGSPGPNSPPDADSVPGNGVSNGEDDAAWVDWRVN